MGDLINFLYLSSPALPVGGFAWSGGLASAIDSGLVKSETLADWIGGVLEYGLGRNDLPLLARCFNASLNQSPGDLETFNGLALASRETLELIREEEEMGRAVGRLVASQKLWPFWLPASSELGYVASFAVLAMVLGCSQDDTADVLAAFAFSWLSNQVAAAARCLPLGQSSAQALILNHKPVVWRVITQALAVKDDEIGASLPVMAILSSWHEGQHSRMFRS